MVHGYITLDHLVRSLIINQSRSVHYYWPYLKLASDCLRELYIDTIGVISTRKYVPEQDAETFAVEIPGCAFYIKSISINGKVDCQFAGESCATLAFTDVKAGDILEVEFVMLGGSDCCAADKVPVVAQATIEAYMLWKRSNGRNNKDSAEGRLYYNELRILRGRVDELKMNDVKPGRLRN